jgi:hypothetical protein
MLEKRLSGPILFSGFDDSNHAGSSKGEIIVAVFSTIHEDSIVKPCLNRRDYSAVSEWLENPQRDYCFTILTAEKFRYSNQNLALVAPFLLREYLRKNIEFNPQKVKLYLDGRLDARGKSLIRANIGEKIPTIPEIIIDSFIKKGKNRRGHIQKHPECPFLVYAADVLANQLLNMSLNESLTHDKLINYL